ncbi:fructosamine kinase family protein [Mycobacterium sp. 1274761.0]|uniref:fructosamine kinase family protein n=1 Tax=Mycobacterium sp. 1274761.0 TaxID=1834077 RepID=UPI0007FD7E26|nr:fructosamine kinase family protein [Mycobacterium sp. 1274761.0]OBK76456.1 fructosamine kinase [Mycobacterium sp. 1274761.0]
MTDFIKASSSAPQGFFELEAAGLRWLSVEGGVPCARVIAYDDHSLTLQRLKSVAPTRDAAKEFGSRLAVTHGAGAEYFGSGPEGWHGDGYFGPLAEPLPMSLRGHRQWGVFYAEERLRPMADLAESRLHDQAKRLVEAVTERCRAGEFDDDDAPARIHGDLWSGNVMWTPDGAVLIDPAAHGGHRETDLAMLALFDCPYLDEVLAAYRSVWPLREGWGQRVGLHQLYPLLAHVVLFGEGYVGQTEAAARSALAG